jgi:hypothetical protein
MKIILLFALFLFPFYAFTQKVNIKFQATEETSEWIRKEWKSDWNEMKSPINIEFNGEVLKMYYNSGKLFGQYTVASYEKKDAKNEHSPTITGEIYTLEVKDEKNRIVKYLVLRTHFFGFKEGIEWYRLEIPFVGKDDKKVYSYQFYQGWTE